MDPGAMSGTDLLRTSPLPLKILMHWILPLFIGILNYLAPTVPFRTTKVSGGDLLCAALGDELGKHPKAVNLVGRVQQITSAETRDESKQKELWNGSLSLAGIKEEETVLVNWK